jgi:hypothetical protein
MGRNASAPEHAVFLQQTTCVLGPDGSASTCTGGHLPEIKLMLSPVRPAHRLLPRRGREESNQRFQ